MVGQEYLNVVSDLTKKMLLAISETGDLLVSETFSACVGLKDEGPFTEPVELLRKYLPEWGKSWDLNQLLNQTVKANLHTLDGVMEVGIEAKRHPEGTIVICLDEIGEFERYKEHAERLHALKDKLMHLSSAMMTIDNQSTLLELILDTAISSLEQATVGSILVFETDEILKIIASRGYSLQDADAFRLPLEESFYLKVTGGNVGEVIVIKDISDYREGTPIIVMEDGQAIRSVISAPLIVDGKLYGFMNLDGRGIGEFSEGDKEIFTYLKQQVEEVLLRYKMYNDILYLSRYDHLTGVLNRNHFEEVYQGYVKNHVETNNGFTVAIFDVDELKTVNDNFGHHAGDKLIKTFTDKMKEVFEGEDLIARLGGDEFILVSDRLTRSDVLSRLSSMVSYFDKTMIEYNSLYYACNFSYGISSFPNDSSDRSVLMKLADERMYENKKKRK